MKHVGSAAAEFAFYGEPQHETRPDEDPERLRVVTVSAPPERALYRDPHFPSADWTLEETPETEPQRVDPLPVRVRGRQ